LRTLRQIPKVVGQTDAGETIYEARSARLVLRADAAHFNRLVRCTKCGREVPGRAVLGPADLDQPAQEVVCNDCVEAATARSSRPGAPAQPPAVNDPAVADAQAEMNLGLEELVDELGAPGDDEAGEVDVLEPEEAEGDEPEEAPPAEEEVPAVNLQLMDDVAGPDEDDLPAPEDDEVLMASAALDDVDEAVAPAPVGDEAEPPAPEDDKPVLADDDAGPVEAEEAEDENEVEAQPPAPAVVDAGPDDEGLARRLQALEERLTSADPLDPLRLVALEETVNRLADRADTVQFAVQARLDELAGATAAAQGKKEGDKLRRRLDQIGERLEQLQASVDAEWVRAKSETATLAQTIADLGERVLRLAQQAGDSAGVEDERVTAVEEKVTETATRLNKALEVQRRDLQDGLQKGLADIRSAIPPPPASSEDFDARFRALERLVQQNKGEVSELNELHAALDAGLGALRAELGDIRTGMGRLADSKADLDDRLETFVRMSLVPEGDKGRKAKKAAESTLGTLSAAVQDLIREQRQLKDSIAAMEQASDAATAAAARASMQASSLGPLRSDVKLLHQEIAEHQEELDALRRAIDRLRPAPAAIPPPAARPPAKKAAATKAPAKAAPATKAAAAKAALARAAATQAAAGKAPAAKRAPRAKKA
jgi:hypothetical protein